MLESSELQSAVAAPSIFFEDLDSEIDYARETLRSACARALEACSQRPAASAEEELRWTLKALRATRSGNSAVVAKCRRANPRLHVFMNMDG